MSARLKMVCLGGACAALAVALCSGCVTKSRVKADVQAAFLAGQNAALRQQQQQEQAAQFRGVTIVGPVQHSHVPWVAGLTLAQAVATANYLDSHPPQKIIIKRHGQSATLDGQVLFSGTNIPLEAGDVVELH